MSRPKVNYFRLYNIVTGELVVEGTSKECGLAIGASEDAIGQAWRRTLNGTYKGYQIEGVSEAERDADIIKKWDDLVEPLRKKYGIPVYREERKNGKE